MLTRMVKLCFIIRNNIQKNTEEIRNELSSVDKFQHTLD